VDLPEPSSPSTAMSFPGYLGRFETTPPCCAYAFFSQQNIPANRHERIPRRMPRAFNFQPDARLLDW